MAENQHQWQYQKLAQPTKLIPIPLMVMLGDPTPPVILPVVQHAYPTLWEINPQELITAPPQPGMTLDVPEFEPDERHLYQQLAEPTELPDEVFQPELVLEYPQAKPDWRNLYPFQVESFAEIIPVASQPDVGLEVPVVKPDLRYLYQRLTDPIQELAIPAVVFTPSVVDDYPDFEVLFEAEYLYPVVSDSYVVPTPPEPAPDFICIGDMMRPLRPPLNTALLLMSVSEPPNFVLPIILSTELDRCRSDPYIWGINTPSDGPGPGNYGPTPTLPDLILDPMWIKPDTATVVACATDECASESPATIVATVTGFVDEGSSACAPLNGTYLMTRDFDAGQCRYEGDNGTAVATITCKNLGDPPMGKWAMVLFAVGPYKATGFIFNIAHDPRGIYALEGGDGCAVGTPQEGSASVA